MSNYVKYYNANQMFYKGFAEKWVKWANDTNYNIREAEGMTMFFRPIAKRFGLIKEFKELGIL
jgi:hypothetical protein